MPHIAVKLHAGRSEKEKQTLADEMTKVLNQVIGSQDESISVSIEDIQPSEWMSKVFDKEIVRDKHLLYKRPGYAPV